jgi:hypothetical protein
LLVRLGTLGARLLPRNVILRLAAGTVQQLNQKPRALPQVPLSESDGLPAPIQEPFIQAIQPLRAPEQASFQIPAGGQRISIELHD